MANILDLGQISYASFLELQEAWLRKKIQQGSDDIILFAEHEPVYTAGIQVKSAPSSIQGIAVYRVQRGGKMTYHGPGMLMAYFLIDLKAKRLKMRRLIELLLDCGRRAMGYFGVEVKTQLSHPGLWKDSKKVASCGFAVSSWITSHGLAFHVNNDLSPFYAISPCGLPPEKITTMRKEIGHAIPMQDFKNILAKEFESLL